ncbi:MAG: formate/nitrite transporter family protein [Clostridia bacterium]|nr:formate/nitrite transporter family protein [Clostridia bacterium]
MTVLSPAEIMQKQSDASVGKANGGVLKLFILGILAGAFIAFGACGSMVASFNLTSDPATFGVGKVLMAAVFPVGLMMVVMCGAELFTGNCLMVIGALDKKIRWGQIWRNWAIVYAGNFVGSFLIALCAKISGMWDYGGGLLGAMTVKTAIGKCGLDFMPALVMGICCNVLVCLAVWMATGSGETIGKIFAIWFCIGLFIICGFEHSVANMYFIPAGMMAASNDAYVSLLGLDTSGLKVFNFVVRNLLPVTIGNILGGSLFIGATYWLTYRKLK